MLKLSIRPQWQIEHADGGQLLPRLLGLLVKVHECGSLAEACKQLDLSYRYAWGLLQEGGRAFGVPLVKMTRGRGASLTPLGEKLVWADRRISARLSPLLDSIASELEVEVERALQHVQSVPRLQASHGFAVETLRRWLLREQVPVDLKYRNVQDALASLNSGGCDLAGFHLPLGEFEAPALRYYQPWLKPAEQRLLHLATRRQGLILATGNPRRITRLTNLSGPGLSFVNREAGSGTRLLIDLLLQHHRIAASSVHGYDNCEFTHAAVAAYVASGMADAGFGVEMAARQFQLDFIPLVTERYFLVCTARALDTPAVRGVLDILLNTEFRAAVNALAGYDASDCGRVQSLEEAFPEARLGRERN